MLLASIVAVSIGCGEEPPERPPIIWTGNHLQVGTDLDLAAWCPGTLPLLDRHIGHLKTLLGTPADQITTYYVYPPPITDYACREPFRACYAEGAVFTTDIFDLHEVVHGVSGLHGSMPHFFEEGAASYWGDTPDADYRNLDIREVLDKQWSNGLSNAGYALAAHFTSYLLHTTGLAAYVSLLKTTTRDESREAFERSFSEAMGMTLDDAIDDYEEQWTFCDARATQQWFYSCAQQPSIALPGGEWTNFELDISCADLNVAGPSTLVTRDGAARIWRDITVDVETSEQFVAFDVPEPGETNTVSWEIKRCDTDCRNVVFSTRDFTLDGMDSAFSFTLTPGRYVVRVSRTFDDPGPVHFRWIGY